MLEPQIKNGISVAIRIRPFNERENKLGEWEPSVTYDDCSVQTRTNPPTKYSFGKSSPY
jgi:hypothetical protein